MLSSPLDDWRCAIAVVADPRGGLLWHPWRTMGPSAVVYGLAKIAGLFSDLLGGSLFLYAQSVLELAFVLMLFYGFYFFVRARRPRNEAPRQ